MAERQFRFRLPWLSAATAWPTVEASSSRPRVETQAPLQQATSIPIQRPPFRSTGTVPVQPPPQDQVQRRTESQPSSPLRAATARPPDEPSSPRSNVETQAPIQRSTSIPIQRPPFLPPVTVPMQTPQSSSPPRAATEFQVQPTSPPRATTRMWFASAPASPTRPAGESRLTSQPSSPSSVTIQTRPASQVGSPSLATTQPRVSSVPSSPSRTTLQPQSVLQPAQELGNQTPFKPSLPRTESTKEEPMVSLASSPPKHLPLATDETAQLGPMLATLSTRVTAPETPIATQKLNSNAVVADHDKHLLKLLHKKATEEFGREPETTNAGGHAKITDIGTQAKEIQFDALQAEQRKHEEKDGSDRMKMTTFRSNGEQIKPVSLTHPKARSTFHDSHRKPLISNGEQVQLHKEIREDIAKFVRNLRMGQQKYPVDENPVSVITLAGENRGASMHLGSESARKDAPVHIHHGYKINPDESTDATTDAEGSTRKRKPEDQLTKEGSESKAYINSNIQSINNSMMFSSSEKQRNPGVHLAIVQDQASSSKLSIIPEPFESRKAEFNVTPAEKLTYQPRVRRRCLRGLFLEPSDSDPDNPDKPRKHGCLYNCVAKRKDKDIECSNPVNALLLPADTE